MTDLETGATDNRHETVFDFTLEILRQISDGWDVGEIAGHTPLGSLPFDSLTFVFLLVEIQQNYNLEDLLLRRLRALEIDIRELRVTELVGLIEDTIVLQRSAGAELG